MYKYSKDSKIWEKAMTVKTKQIEKEAPYDVEHLYLELEQISRKYFESGQMQNGDTFDIPFKDGSSITMTFHPGETELIRTSATGKENTIIIRGENPDTEYQHLNLMSNLYEDSGYGIGEPHPNELESLLEQAREGDVITFSDSGKMFLCRRVDDTNIIKDFYEIPKYKYNGNLNAFKPEKSITINLSNKKNIQDFYDDNRNFYTSRCEFSCDTNDNAQLWINRITGNLEQGKSMIIDFAGIHLAAQKQKDNTLRWYDSSDSSIDESLVKVCYAYFHTTPVERKIIHDSKTAQAKFNDTDFIKELQNVYAQNDFASACNIIKNECIKNETGYMYHEKSIIQESDTKFVPKSFAFYFKNGEVQVSEIEFENNDVTKPLKSKKASSFTAFAEYCKKKYDDRYHLLYSKTETDLRLKFPKKDMSVQNTPFFTRMVELETTKKITKDESSLIPDRMEYMRNELYDILANTEQDDTRSIDETMEMIDQ